THGKPEEYNAHPHSDRAEKLAVVQNGIVENFHVLREELKQRGHEFVTETDTEVIPHLIAETLAQLQKAPPDRILGSLLLEAVRQSVQRLQGAFALAIAHAD
ncbi:MAG TPA: glutamine--fructose-6-phosphate aminotransferase, partial [Cyanobacteria bacterium UBA8156]|nr:glutamine--fructose-6-phosphate aminotransferase [Cyanobacteria bacterium UBA8156]